jgi:hydrogenase nickel incorporation protein HypA/HybF
MHEAAAMKGVITAALENFAQSGAMRILEVEMVLSRADHFTEEAARTYFEALTPGTPLEGVSLRIAWQPATYRCFNCLEQFESDLPSEEAVCPECNGTAIEVEHRHDCYLSGLEVEFSDKE